ncbi:hypothetical protein B5S50_16450 [Clostridium sp. 001]|nr:hypothetical protein B5S50_16450 [Clostridium sp. 001]
MYRCNIFRRISVMYRCPFMDQDEYMEEDYMYDGDMDYPQNMYSPDFYRMCPMFLNARKNAYMRCMYPTNYMQTPAPTYPYYDSEEKTEYVPFDEKYEDLQEETEQEEEEPEEKNMEDEQETVDDSYGGTRIRTVDISDIQD